MLKKSLIGLVLIGLLAGATLAADPVNYFLPIYMIKGQVTSVAPATIDQHMIRFTSGEVIGALATPETGSYLLNPYEAQYFGTFPIELGSSLHKISVPNGADGLGMASQPVALNDYGFTIQDITLGNVITLVEGAVILTIERVAGSKIKVTWAINTAPPYTLLPPTTLVDIYYQTGTGSGEYSPTGWVNKVVDSNGSAGVSGVTVNTAGKYLEWDSQVGGGNNELYFAACVEDQATHADFGLTKAVPVGKFNISIKGPAAGESYKYSIISVPFYTPDASANAVFGNQLVGGSSMSDSTELWGWTGTTFGNQMYLNSTTGWQTIGAFTPFQHASGNSYVIKTKTGATDKIMTVAGKVINIPFGPYAMGANRYTFFANPYPTQLVLTSLSSTAGVLGGAASGFSDQLWQWTTGTFGQQSYYNTTASDWGAITPFPAVSTLGASKGFVYRRKDGAPAGGFSWNIL